MAGPDLRSVAFPVLSDEQIAALASCSAASLERYPDGHVLIKIGDQDFKFFVVSPGASRSWTNGATRRSGSPSTRRGSSPAT